MIAWLPLAATLAASLAFGQAGPGSPAASAQKLADLRGSMEHWVLMARPDSVDPDVRQLAQDLTALHNRAVALKPDDAVSVNMLQSDFNDWKDRFAKLAFDRRPAAAPNDYAVYRAQLEKGIRGLQSEHVGAAGADKQVTVLRRLVDPLAFQWYVDGSRDRAGAGGAPSWLTSRAPANGGGPRVASADLPPGWTQPNAPGGADLQTEAPPDPAVVAGVQKIGEREYKNGGTIGACYAGVKGILERLGVVSSFDGRRGRDGEGKLILTNELEGAYQFNKWVQDHPTLQNRKLLRVPEPAWPLAISDIVVWGRGVCGYNDDWGHIEMIYKLSPDKRRGWAVSDHSQEFNVDCFKRVAERAVDAKSQLDGLRQSVADAQQAAAAAGKGKDRRAALKARRTLAQLRAALAKAEDAAEAVSVYKISREKPR